MTPLLSSITSLLAADPPTDLRQARLKAISEYWGAGDALPVEWLLIAAGLLLLLIAALSLRAWWRNRHLRSSPLVVFNQVAAACRLTASERLLLWRIARQQNLPTPLALMLAPTTLSHHARLACDGRSRAGRAWQLRRVARLRRKLFSESDAHATPTTASGNRL